MTTKPFLFILTSHNTLGETGEPTGFHFEEVATPYYILQDAGINVEIGSIKGMSPHPDPSSVDSEDNSKNPDSVRRFINDTESVYKLENARPVDEYDMNDFSGVYMPGGHGTMWDFPDNPALQELITDAYEGGKAIAAICHGPAAFVNLEKDGRPLVQGYKINSFTDEEEKAVGKDSIVPFLLETRLRECGADFQSTEKWGAICVEDGPFVTGQNPASAQQLGEKLHERVLRNQKAA